MKFPKNWMRDFPTLSTMTERFGILSFTIFCARSLKTALAITVGLGCAIFFTNTRSAYSLKADIRKLVSTLNSMEKAKSTRY